MRRWMKALAALAIAASAGIAHAQAPTEAALKAAFLYKFAGYVEWPPAAFGEPASPFVIGVVGADDVLGELERTVQGRTLLDRPIALRRLQPGDSLRGVRILFIDEGHGNGRAMIRAAQAAGTLVVTETERGLDLGAAINFVALDGRIGFEVSLDGAERAGIRISSRMLAVARRVIPRPKTSGVGDTELVRLEQRSPLQALRFVAAIARNFVPLSCG